MTTGPQIQTRRSLAGLLAALVAVLAALLAAPGAVASPGVDATISGRVTDSRGEPVRYVLVTANVGDEAVASSRTGADGSYSLTHLGAGSYVIRAVDPWQDYAVGWYRQDPSAAEATPVHLSAGETRSGLDVSLTPSVETPSPAAVTGLLRDRTGLPRRGGWVWAYGELEPGAWSVVARSRVRADGHFLFTPEQLAPGEYKFEALGDGWVGNPGIVPRFFGGGADVDDAPAHSLEAGEELDLGTLWVTRKATISGVLTVPAAAGYPTFWGTVSATPLSGGRPVQTSPAASGEYAVEVAPGTHTVWFAGGRGSETMDSLEYFGQWWRTAHLSQKPTPITVGEGEVAAGISAVLGRRIVALAAPRVTGRALAGYRLSASAGDWNLNEAEVAYRWKVGAKTVGTGPTYAVRTADRGKLVSVTVSARDREGRFEPGTATSAAVRAKSKPYLGLIATNGRKSSRVTVSLTLAGTPRARTTGAVRIYEGSRRLATLRVVRGQARRTLRLSPGRHRLRAVYAGSREYTRTSVTEAVKVRKG